MKKLLFIFVLAAINMIFAEDETKGIKYSELKLADRLYLQSQSDQLMKPFRQKSDAREDSFYVSYQHETTKDDDQSEAGDIYTNDTGRILQPFCITTSYTSSAYLSAHCDEGYVYEPITYTLLTTNNAELVGNKLTVSKQGLYTVQATDSRGKFQIVDIPFSQKIDKKVEYINLISFTNENTVAAWQEYLTDLQNSERLPDLIWTYELDTSNIQTNGHRTTFRVPFSWTNHSLGPCYRGGNVWPNALSPHVMCTAWHYGWSHWWSSTVTLTNKVSGGFFTIHKSAPWIHAGDWARSHGWTEEEVAEMGLGDFALIVIDNGSIPEECCPYLTDEKTLVELFGESFRKDLPTWYWGQDPSEYAFAYGINRPNFYSATSQYIPYWVREITNTMTPFNWRGLISGDSGRPVIFKWKNQLTIVNLDLGDWGLVRGKGLEVLKAFCAQFGDTIKVMEK